MLNRFSQAFVLELLWHFLVLNDSLSSVITESACVKLQFEVIGSAIGDLNRTSIVQLSHTFDLGKHDVISVFV